MVEPSQLVLELDGTPAASFDDFFVGGNEAVCSAIKALAENGQSGLIYLIGAQGCGRSHLLAAACQLAQDNGFRAAYIASEVLRKHGPDVLLDFDSAAFLALDDIDRLVGHPEWEEALFHLFNRLVRQQSALLVSAPAVVAKLDVKLPDLRSRLSSGTSLTLSSLTDEGKAALLLQHATRRGITMAPEVVRYLMHRVGRDLPGLLGMLDALARDSLAAHKRITVPFVRRWLTQTSKD